MPSFEDTASIFERMTEMANMTAGFNESFLNSLSAIESVAATNLNLGISITSDGGAAEVQNQLISVAEGAEEANRRQNEYNESLKECSGLAGKLGSGIKSLAGSLGGFLGVSSMGDFLSLSDDYTVGLKEIENTFNGADSSAVRSGVMAAANNSGISYASMQESVLSLGQSGFGANEAVAFAELANKAYAVAGYSGNDQQGAVSQLVSAMSAGDVQASVEALSLSPELYSSLENYVSGINTAGMSMEEMAAKGLHGAECLIR